MEILTLICSIVSFIISLISLIMGIIAFVELRSFMKSTHKVQFVPMDNTQSKDINRDSELEEFGIV